MTNLEGLIETFSSNIRAGTDWYFQPKKFEEDGTIYERLGIKPVKRFVTWMGRTLSGLKTGENIGKRNHYFLWDFSQDGLLQYERTARLSEAFHLVFGIYTGYGTIQYCLHGDATDAVKAGALTVAGAYAVMLQRYNRARIYRVVDFMNRRNASEN